MATSDPAIRGVRVIIAGGGTSGHVLPGIAIAEMLEDHGVPARFVHFVGASGGIDGRLLNNTDYPKTLFPVVGLRRSMHLVAIKQNLNMVRQFLVARRALVRFFKEWKPGVVVSVGGYASLPAMSAAAKLGIPRVVVSYDSRPGLATRRQARKATIVTKATAVSTLPNAILVGAPVRRELRQLNCLAVRQDARARLGLPDGAFVVGVLGGSLGSGILNSVAQETAEKLGVEKLGAIDNESGGTSREVAWYHIAGERFLDSCKSSAPAGANYTVVGYESDMASVYAACDLLVTRAGASTISEIATVGVASIIVPWAGASENHQEHNAQSLVGEGAAIMILESEFTAKRLTTHVKSFSSEPSVLEEMRNKAFASGVLHRAGELGVIVATVAITGNAPVRR